MLKNIKVKMRTNQNHGVKYVKICYLYPANTRTENGFSDLSR